jgi:hypothetical protein
MSAQPTPTHVSEDGDPDFTQPQVIELINGRSILAVLGPDDKQNWGTPDHPEWFRSILLMHPLQIVCQGDKFLCIKYPFLRETEAVTVDLNHIVTVTPLTRPLRKSGSTAPERT